MVDFGACSYNNTDTLPKVMPTDLDLYKRLASMVQDRESELEHLRDEMDTLWYKLSKAERASLTADEDDHY